MGVDHSNTASWPQTRGQKPWRLLNRDGSFNVRKPRHVALKPHDLYHSLLAIRWVYFLLILCAGYLGANFVFAILYFLLGPGALSTPAGHSGLQRFADCFFFSVQTFATIGYGKITPDTLAANIIVTFEALTGLFSIALATGLVFARFARPTSRVVFSSFAVVNAHDGTQSFMFRIANERFNQIVEAQIRVVLSISEMTSEGEWYRTLYDLKLERSSTPIFGLSWTVIHPIDSLSPLFGKTHADLMRGETELICSFVGMDDTFAQTINSRFSYTPAEILWDHRFTDILSREDGTLVVDIDGIDGVEPISTEASSLIADRRHRAALASPL